MDDTFLRYYENELDHLRVSSQRFAAEFPKIARRLQLGEQECADPYVERLLEGVAFLTARISRKLDDAQAELPETLLNQIAPEFNAPIASRAVLNLRSEEPDTVLPAGTPFSAPTSLPDKLSCCYSLREPFTTSGISIRSCSWDDGPALELAARAGLEAEGALRLSLDCGPHGPLDDVDFFIRLPESAAGALLELLTEACAGIIAESPGQGTSTLPPDALTEPEAPQDAMALPPVAEYFIAPEQFSFFRIRHLRRLLPERGSADLLLLLRRRPDERLRLLLRGEQPLLTDCVRAINVFERRIDRALPSWKPAEHLVADVTGTQNYEVLRVLSAAAYDGDNARLFDLYPFYLADDLSAPVGTERLNYFATHRETPVAPPRHRVSPYAGSEVYIQLSGPDYTERRDSISSIAVRALCSNRDLPLFLRRDARLSGEGAQATFASPPGGPRAPLTHHGARWLALALARLTPATLAAYGEQALPAVLRTLLHHLHPEEDEAARRQVEGITAVRIGATSRPVPVLGDLCVMRGWHFVITLNEQAFGDSGVYHFARALADFLLSLTEINSFTTVTVRTGTRCIRTWQQQEPA